MLDETLSLESSEKHSKQSATNSEQAVVVSPCSATVDGRRTSDETWNTRRNHAVADAAVSLDTAGGLSAEQQYQQQAQQALAGAMMMVEDPDSMDENPCVAALLQDLDRGLGHLDQGCEGLVAMVDGVQQRVLRRHKHKHR